MKTIEAFIGEIEGSAELQDELKAVKDEGALAEFLEKHGVDGTVEELAEAVKVKAEAEGEIPDDEAEAVAGGKSSLSLSGARARLFRSVWPDYPRYGNDV